MKKYNILFCTVCFLMLTGCTDFLEENNQSRTTPDSLEELLLVMGPTGNVTGPFVSRDSRVGILSDDFKPPLDEIIYDQPSSGDYVYQLAMTWEDPPFVAGRLDPNWGDPYKGIWLCNLTLIKLEEDIEPTDDPELFNRTKGEALAQRALLYSHLVNDFARHYDSENADSDLGVPLNVSINLEQSLSRATVQEVYDFIESDLNEAKDLLPPMTPDHPRSAFRPGAASVYALLARIHLYKQEWEKAAEAASNSLSIYDFVYDYNDPSFTESTPSFSIVFGGQVDRESIWQRGGGSQFFQVRDQQYSLSDDLVSSYDTTGNDLRWEIFVEIDNGVTNYTKAKFFVTTPQGGLRRPGFNSNFGVSTPEVILTLAEAQARLGNISEAMVTLDRLTSNRYLASTYTAPTADNPSEALEIVLAERRKELLYTGIRWVDQKRLQVLGEYDKTVTRVTIDQTYTLEPGSPKYTLLIPHGIVTGNNNIEQNPR